MLIKDFIKGLSDNQVIRIFDIYDKALIVECDIYDLYYENKNFLNTIIWLREFGNNGKSETLDLYIKVN